MADVLKFGRKGQQDGEEIPAALREFIDAVIVPALVRDYLGGMKVSKSLAPPSGVVSDSSSDVLVVSEVRR
jgi:hypothetical protein